MSIEYLEGDNIGKKYRVKMKVSVGKKRYGIEFDNGKSLENNGNKKRDISYISHFKCVKSRFLLYKNDFKFQLGFKVVVKKGTNKIKSSLQTIDF